MLALQALCCLDVQGDDADAALERFFAEADSPAPVKRRARALLDAARGRREQLDAELKSAVRDWDVGRMTLVDRNVIRLADAEWSMTDVPPLVAMSEAIEIAREFGAADSPAFVNGVLDALYKRRGEGTEREV